MGMDARSPLVTLLLCTVLSTGFPVNNRLVSVSIDEITGAFNISLNNVVWFGSSGKGVSLRHENILYSVDDNSLVIDAIDYGTGQDNWGIFKDVSLTYSTVGLDEAKSMIGVIRTYPGRAVTFEQYMVDSLNGTSSGDADGVVTSFPVFDIDEEVQVADSSCLWTSWDGEFTTDVTDDDNMAEGSNEGLNSERRKLLVAPGFKSPTCRSWTSSQYLPGGIAGTGPMVIWSERFMKEATESLSTDEMGGNEMFFPTFVLSPMENPMAMNLDASKSTNKPGRVSYGIIGNASFVPAGFSTTTVLYLGDGINGVMSEWGQAMRSWFNKQEASSARRSDITLQYLGYSTDNGAYYYYNTVTEMNYEQTMAAIKQDADDIGLPFAYSLLDSWWYEHGESDGVEKWDAVSSVFPDGMASVYNATNWLIQAHNRWWDPSNVYATANGGEFEFDIDQSQGGAVPLEQAFWDKFLRGKSGWGLRVYEQDWLWNEFAEKVRALQEDPTLGRRWLTQMARGAEKNGLTIQYCMPHMRHLLQSLEFSVVTQARASDDYKPNNQQWAIGGQNVLFDALGLAPSKDSYWSASDQPGNPYEGTANSYEPFPEQQAVVSTLSAGPVATSDGIGFADSDLILRACMKDGRLLQPSSPAKLIDRAFRYRAGNYVEGGVDGEVWGAWSEAAGRVFGYVFAANLSQAMDFVPSDMKHLGGSLSSHHHHVMRPSKSTVPSSPAFKMASDNVSPQKWIAVNVRDVLSLSNSSKNAQGINAQVFSAESPIKLSSCNQDDFALWAILPLEPNGMAFYGEVDKWIGVTAARTVKLSTSVSSSSAIETAKQRVANGKSLLKTFENEKVDGSSYVIAEMIGSSSEVLSVGFVNQDLSLTIMYCEISQTGRVKVSPTTCSSQI